MAIDKIIQELQRQNDNTGTTATTTSPRNILQGLYQ
jgi:hypothetical protein